MAEKARPNTSRSLFPQTEKSRRFGNWAVVVLYALLGVLYLVKAAFERHLSQGH